MLSWRNLSPFVWSSQWKRSSVLFNTGYPLTHTRLTSAQQLSVCLSACPSVCLNGSRWTQNVRNKYIFQRKGCRFGVILAYLHAPVAAVAVALRQCSRSVVDTCVYLCDISFDWCRSCVTVRTKPLCSSSGDIFTRLCKSFRRAYTSAVFPPFVPPFVL